MKKFSTTFIALLLLASAANAQTQKDWYIIGSHISDINLDLQKGNTGFGLTIDPRVAWFVKDNFAIGAQVVLSLNTSKGFTTFGYGVGPIARYYFKNNALESVNKTRWFLDADIGLAGLNTKVTGNEAVNTNGLGLGIGPGLAYFINQNIALEGLVKYNYTKGFGNDGVNTNGINFGIGFQIHLPQAKIRDMRNDVNRPVSMP